MTTKEQHKYTICGVFEIQNIVAKSEEEALVKAKAMILSLEKRNTKLILDIDHGATRLNDQYIDEYDD